MVPRFACAIWRCPSATTQVVVDVEYGRSLTLGTPDDTGNPCAPPTSNRDFMDTLSRRNKADISAFDMIKQANRIHSTGQRLTRWLGEIDGDLRLGGTYHAH